MKKKVSIGLASLAKKVLKESTKRVELKEEDRVYEMGYDIEGMEFIVTFEYSPEDGVDIRSLEFKGVDFWDFIFEIHKNPNKLEKDIEERALEFAMNGGDSDEYDDWRDRNR